MCSGGEHNIMLTKNKVRSNKLIKIDNLYVNAILMTKT